LEADRGRLACRCRQLELGALSLRRESCVVSSWSWLEFQQAFPRSRLNELRIEAQFVGGSLMNYGASARRRSKVSDVEPFFNDEPKTFTFHRVHARRVTRPGPRTPDRRDLPDADDDFVSLHFGFKPLRGGRGRWMRLAFLWRLPRRRFACDLNAGIRR